MDPTVFFAVVAIFYGVALFFDLFFKSCMHYPYEAFLHNTGLNVKFLRLNWHTTALNRTIFRWGSSCSKILVQSFNIGIVVTVILLPFGIAILLLTLFRNSNDTNSSSDESMTNQKSALSTAAGVLGGSRIEILVPGINLPLEEIGFYIITLIICSVVHELGHALAAVLEDIPVSGFGIQVYFCIPIAYTALSTEHMNSLKGIRKMRVLCGGIWHNVVLATFCYFIFCTMTIFLSPFYRINESVIITDIHKNSPLLGGEKGLFKNDVITQINNCKVQNTDTWFDCLLQSIKNKPAYCVSSDFIRLNDESVPIVHGMDGIIHCCSNDDPLTNLKMSCFEYVLNDDLSDADDPIEIPQHTCLNIRNTIQDSYGFCESGSMKCDTSGSFCIKPLLNNLTTILIIKRNNLNNILNNDESSSIAATDVIYIGHPTDVSRTIKISQFVPKMHIFKSQLADTISLLLKYNIVISFGLAIVNSIPCFGLDGHHITSTIVNNFLVTKIPERAKRDLIVLFMSSLGTFLFLCSIIKVLWMSIFNKFL